MLSTMLVGFLLTAAPTPDNNGIYTQQSMYAYKYLQTALRRKVLK